jgi:tRNA A-37 threonylcarbamoyl transferase component Bud32
MVLESCRAALESILANETLYAFAARQSEARQFKGRAPVYAVELPDGCGRAVVRRSMRGGFMAALHTDLFLPPTRSIRELIASLRLRAAGVPTPEMIGFAIYKAGTFLRRSDVVTREVEGGTDLASILSSSDATNQRQRSLEATAALVAALSAAGAHHPDLNVRNILVVDAEANASGETIAYVLDVDRIRFHIPDDPMVLRANIERLARSLRKERELRRLAIEDAEITQLGTRAIELARREPGS